MFKLVSGHFLKSNQLSLSKSPSVEKSSSVQDLNRQIRNLKLQNSDKSRMKIPTNRMVKAEGKRLKDLNFLRPFGEFAKYIDIYSIQDTPKLEDANTPSASWIGINFPLKKDPYVKNQFKKAHSDGMRIAKLKEMLDLLGSCSVYRYMGSDILARDTTAVTLSVDKFELFEDTIPTDNDLFISSYATYAGNTSLEIRLDVTYTEQPDRLLASAYYFFVVREASDYSKAKKVPKLVFDGEEDQEGCIMRAEIGHANQIKRKKATATSTDKIAPTNEETQGLHELYKKSLKPNSINQILPITVTSREKTMLMQTENRNIHGKIFGGYLMKESTDLAWVTSYLHGDKDDHPEFFHIDDISFLVPVEIGSVAVFKSYITYVEDNLSHVMVIMDTTKHTGESQRTCEFHITMAHKKKLKKVVPVTYAESMWYIEGKRRIDNMKLVGKDKGGIGAKL